MIFGDYNPAGRTTMTWYANETDLPADVFQYDIRADPESTEPKGTVTDQLPPAGEPHDQGTVVTLFVSTYEPPPPPPTDTPTVLPTPTETPTEGTVPRSSRRTLPSPTG